MTVRSYNIGFVSKYEDGEIVSYVNQADTMRFRVYESTNFEVQTFKQVPGSSKWILLEDNEDEWAESIEASFHHIILFF